MNVLYVGLEAEIFQSNLNSIVSFMNETIRKKVDFHQHIELWSRSSQFSQFHKKVFNDLFKTHYFICFGKLKFYDLSVDQFMRFNEYWHSMFFNTDIGNIASFPHYILSIQIKNIQSGLEQIKEIPSHKIDQFLHEILDSQIIDIQLKQVAKNAIVEWFLNDQ